MSVEEMRDFLTKAQQQTIQNKMLSAILTCYQNIKELERGLIDLQIKVNEIIQNWNVNIENAAPVEWEQDAINNDIAAAEVVKDE